VPHAFSAGAAPLRERWESSSSSGRCHPAFKCINSGFDRSAARGRAPLRYPHLVRLSWPDQAFYLFEVALESEGALFAAAAPVAQHARAGVLSNHLPVGWEIGPPISNSHLDPNMRAPETRIIAIDACLLLSEASYCSETRRFC
jgi:hypothetical protein